MPTRTLRARRALARTHSPSAARGRRPQRKTCPFPPVHENTAVRGNHSAASLNAPTGPSGSGHQSAVGEWSGTDTLTGLAVTAVVNSAGRAALTLDSYQIDLTFKSCTGAYAALNDVELNGLAVLNTDVSPAQLSYLDVT